MTRPADRIRYRAYRPDGEIETGVLEASDEAEAVRLLQSSGRVPFQLRAEAAGPGPAAGLRGLGRRGRLDLARLFGDLSVMLGAGFTVDVALRAVAEAETDRGQAARIGTVLDRITEGQSVSAAFAALPEVPGEVAALLSSGENSGRLDVVAASLATSFARAAARRRELSEALLYPAFLLIVMFGAILLLSLYLAPALAPVFENAGVPPPRLVRALAGFGALLTGPSLAVAAATALGLAALALSSGGEGARRGLDRALARLPVVGGFRRAAAAARYLGTLSLLLANGVPMLEAMQLAAGTAGTPAQRAALLAARQAVAEGAPLSRALAGSGLLPDFTLALVRLGEQSDHLAPMLGRAAAIVEAQLQRRISRLLTFLTPALTITLGLVVGGLVISVMTTLLSINDIALQ